MDNPYDALMQSIKYGYRQEIYARGASPAEIDEFERKLGYRLPDDYKCFVRKYGGTMGNDELVYYGDLEDPLATLDFIMTFDGLTPGRT